jgi:hypothetical protein
MVQAFIFSYLGFIFSIIKDIKMAFKDIGRGYHGWKAYSFLRGLANGKRNHQQGPSALSPAQD